MNDILLTYLESLAIFAIVQKKEVEINPPLSF